MKEIKMPVSLSRDAAQNRQTETQDMNHHHLHKERNNFMIWPLPFSVPKSQRVNHLKGRSSNNTTTPSIFGGKIVCCLLNPSLVCERVFFFFFFWPQSESEWNEVSTQRNTSSLWRKGQEKKEREGERLVKSMPRHFFSS